MPYNFFYSDTLSPSVFKWREGRRGQEFFLPLETGECRSKSPTRKHAWRNVKGGGDLTDSPLHARVALGVALRRVAVWGPFTLEVCEARGQLWGRLLGPIPKCSQREMGTELGRFADLICKWPTHQSSQNGRRAERRSRYSQWLFSFPQIYSKFERVGASITYLECHKRNMVSMGQPEVCYLFWNYFQPFIPTSHQQGEWVVTLSLYCIPCPPNQVLR